MFFIDWLSLQEIEMELRLLQELGAFEIGLAKNILFLSIFFNCEFKKKVKVRLLIISCIAAITLASYLFLDLPDIVIEMSNTLIILLSILNLFQGKVWKTGILFVIGSLALNIVDVIVYFIIIYLPIEAAAQIAGNRLAMQSTNMISFIILCIILILQKKLQKSFSIPLQNLHWSNYLLIAWTFFSFTLLLSYLEVIDSESSTVLTNVLIFGTSGVTLGGVIIVVLLTRAAYMRDKYKEGLELNRRYLEIQQEYYISLSEKNEVTKRFRHDIRNHLLCIQMLAQEGKLKDITDYLNRLSVDLQEISSQINSGSSVVDAIINDKLAKYPEIVITVNGGFPDPLYISAADLCTIFSNILSNAVEAVLKLEKEKKREIIISIKNHENYIYIRQTNPIKEMVQIKDNTVHTTKPDQEMHGFGLGNIKRKVQEYCGSVDISCTQAEFTIDIVMKNVKNDRLK